MEKINLQKRNKIKKSLYSIGGLFLLSVFFKDFSSFTKQSLEPRHIIKDSLGRIVEIKTSTSHMKFNPSNPLDYEVLKSA